MLDSYSQIWNKVLLRCPSLSPKLAQDFVVNAFRRLAERRRWSWLVKSGQFITPQVYTTGTVTVVNGSTTVVGSGTVWTAVMVGQQFRVGNAAPIYTIAQFDSATQFELDQPFGGPSGVGAGYNIYQCFFPVPQDFHQFITVWDPAFAWQLYLDIDQVEINGWDPQRANVSNSYLVSFRDYTTSQVGLVNVPVQIVGTGAVPLSGGSFTAPSDAIYTVQITTPGQSGTAVFQWSKNNGAYTVGVLTDAGGAAQFLMDGIIISFPTGVTYNNNDQFIIRAYAISNAGVPRYELWPHQQAQKVFPFLYESRPVDIDDPGAVLPRYIRGDVLVELALEDVALWPGPSEDKQNPYFNARAAAYHASRAENMVNILERQDSEIWQQLITYQCPALSFGLAVPFGDSRWLQSHSV